MLERLEANIDSDWLADSIPISNRAELEAINDNLNGNFHLVADIDLARENWVPLGGQSSPFTGIFDGRGYIITMSSGTLFFHISGAIVKNVYMVNASICGTASGSIVLNSSVTGDISSRGGGGSSIGGLVGNLSNSIIHNSHNAANIDIDTIMNLSVGGIAGSAHNSKVYASYNTGNITGYSWSSNVGGIVGYQSDTIIENSHNTGDITAVVDRGRAHAGGISGYRQWNGNLSVIRNSFNTGNITATGSSRTSVNASAGGIIGRTDSEFIIENCYNKGIVVAFGHMAHAGGIAGHLRGIVRNSYNAGDISARGGNYQVGGIVGGFDEEYFRDTEPMEILSSVESSYSLNLHGSPRGTQLTVEQMRDVSSFIDWDFYTTWRIDANINDGFPYLISNPPPGVNTDEITVTLNGNPLELYVSPIIENDRTLVPFRAIFEALGATVF